MRPSISLLGPLLLLASIGAAAQSTPNPDFYYGSVLESFRKHDPQMVHFSLLYKGQASEELDVILVRGGSPAREWPPRRTTIQEFRPGDLLGLFLVERDEPSRIYELTIEEFLGQVFVERTAHGEITLIPESDYGRSVIRQKYFYQTSSKRLVARREFGPVSHFAVAEDRAVFWGRFLSPWGNGEPNVTFAVIPDGDGFRPYSETASLQTSPEWEGSSVELDGGSLCSIQTEPVLDNTAARQVLCLVNGEPQIFRPPQTDFERFAAARPGEVANGNTEEFATFNETIGPYQVEGDRLWFGLTFYDGESWTGVGAFGSFEMKTRDFEMHYLPDLADWSVSALLVEPEAIWMGLAVNPEGSRYSGGLLRWDRGTQAMQRWPETPVITGIVRQGERLYMGTEEGTAILEDGEFTRYLLDVDRDGSYRLLKRELR